MITSATGSTALLMTGVVAIGEAQGPGTNLGLSYLIAAGLLTGVFQILWGYLRLAYQMRYVPTGCLLYTSPSPRDLSTSRMPSSA